MIIEVENIIILIDFIYLTLCIKGGKNSMESAATDQSMKQLIENEFFDDPLYKEIKIKHPELEDELFPDWIDTLNLVKEYSTTEVSQMINKKDQNIRYYLEQLKDYVQHLRHNRNYRLTYKSIFRLHMIYLLIENGRNVYDIRVALPMYGEGAIVDRETLNDAARKGMVKHTNGINEEILQKITGTLISHMQFSEEKQLEVMETVQNLLETQNELQILLPKINKQVQIVRSLDKKLSHDRATLLDMKQTLRSMNQLSNMTRLINEHKKSGFLKRIKGIFIEEEEVFQFNQTDPKINELTNEIKTIENEITKEEETLKSLETQQEELAEKAKEYLVEVKMLIEETPRLSDNIQISNVLPYLLEETTK